MIGTSNLGSRNGHWSYVSNTFLCVYVSYTSMIYHYITDIMGFVPCSTPPKKKESFDTWKLWEAILKFASTILVSHVSAVFWGSHFFTNSWLNDKFSWWNIPWNIPWNIQIYAICFQTLSVDITWKKSQRIYGSLSNIVIHIWDDYPLLYHHFSSWHPDISNETSRYIPDTVYPDIHAKNPMIHDFPGPWKGIWAAVLYIAWNKGIYGYASSRQNSRKQLSYHRKISAKSEKPNKQSRLKLL